MKKKIVLLPLDERPCNYLFPYQLFSHEDVEIVRPTILGNKKTPADLKEIISFLHQECKDADGLVLSIDMLLYGGLVPSRTHYKTVEELKEIADEIKKLKDENKNLLIYGFQTIMRCPDYSNSDEEPDYYEQYGKMIHEAGDVIHRSRLSLCGDQELKHLLEQIDCEKLNDYVSRRECNREMNYCIIDFVKEGYIDSLVIPQDDSAAYGYAAMDQESVRCKVEKEGLIDRVLMYPGADEVGMTLISRMLNHINLKKPKVYVKYASEASKQVLPIYEGNTLETTIRYQILSAGCQLTESYEFADILLIITAPAERIEEAIGQPSKAKGYLVERNMAEIIDFIEQHVSEGKIVTIGDNAYGNGGELQLIQMLNQRKLLDRVSGYAGWNTSANTLGTAIAEAVDTYNYGNQKEHMNFLMQRYIEDGGYCSMVRAKVSGELESYKMNYFDVKESNGIISEKVKAELLVYMDNYLSSVRNKLTLEKVWMPWSRMFEVGIKATYTKLE